MHSKSIKGKVERLNVPPEAKGKRPILKKNLKNRGTHSFTGDHIISDLIDFFGNEIFTCLAKSQFLILI
jgi:hypothetical protein